LQKKQHDNKQQQGMLLWQQVAFMEDVVFKQFILDICVASDVRNLLLAPSLTVLYNKS
jgi:hypothetical protein